MKEAPSPLKTLKTMRIIINSNWSSKSFKGNIIEYKLTNNAQVISAFGKDKELERDNENMLPINNPK